MRIKELFIKRYGPLRDRSYVLTGRFNLLVGKNEEGKTLTIDALVKLLLGRHVKDFERIQRVEESPEGYLIVEDNEGREVKLPEKGMLTKLAHLTPAECRNLFVIRNSDLSISPEDEFYTNITDRLVGVRTDEISKIKDILREIARITPGGSFRDTRDEKLKTRLEDAGDLIGRIEAIAREVQAEHYDELEEESAACRDERDRIAQEIEILEEARKREKYERGIEALTKLKEALAELENLQAFTFDKAEHWRDCERDIQRLEVEKKRLEEDLELGESELKRISETLHTKERDFRVLEGIKGVIDVEVRPYVVSYEKNRKEFELKKAKGKLFSWTWAVCSGLFAISLLALLLEPSQPFFILAALFLAAAIVAWILQYKFIRNRALLEGEMEKIKLTLSKYELSAERLEEILSNIQRFDTEYDSKSRELQGMRRRKENLEERIGELRSREIPGIDRGIKDAAHKIDEIMTHSNQRSLKGYREKLRLKEGFEKSLGEEERVLKSHFGMPTADLGRNLEHWEKEVSDLETYRDRAADAKYSEGDKLKLQERERQLDARLEEISRKIGTFQRTMAEIQRKANEILRLEDEYLYCETAVDLEAVKKALQIFISENKANRDNATRAIEILDQIEREEKEKVSDLFETESPISAHFQTITGGLYGEVALNREIGQIEVQRKDGFRLGAEKLSGGAYDQLYFSVRLALGEKLMKGSKGFFILDDPFIKADPERLRRQIEMLKVISESGWQIMYFSAKEEVQNALAGDIKKGIVNPIEIQGLVS